MYTNIYTQYFKELTRAKKRKKYNWKHWSPTGLFGIDWILHLAILIKNDGKPIPNDRPKRRNMLPVGTGRTKIPAIILRKLLKFVWHKANK